MSRENPPLIFGPERLDFHRRRRARALGARHQHDAGAKLRLPAQHVAAGQHRIDVEDSGTDDKHRVVLGDREIVDHEGLVNAGDLGRRLSDRAVRANSSPGQVRRCHVVAENHHLAGSRIEPGMGADPERKPAAEVEPADRLEFRAHLVGRQSFLQREVSPGVPDDVDEGVELGGPAGIGVGPEEALVDESRCHDAAVQGAAGALLGLEPAGAHPPVAVPGLSRPDPHGVDHPVAFHRVHVAAERRELRVGAVAHENALDVVGKASVHLQIVGVALAADRGEPPRQVRVSGHVDGVRPRLTHRPHPPSAGL